MREVDPGFVVGADALLDFGGTKDELPLVWHDNSGEIGWGGVRLRDGEELFVAATLSAKTLTIEDSDALFDEREAVFFSRDAVVADRHVPQRVIAEAVGDDRSNISGCGVRHLHLDSCNRRSRRVCNETTQPCCVDLTEEDLRTATGEEDKQ